MSEFELSISSPETLLALTLSNKKLSSLPPILNNCIRLKTLDLNYNNLSTIDLLPLITLKELKVVGNKINSVYNIDKLVFLEILYLQSNQLVTESLLGIYKLYKLTVVNINRNNINSLYTNRSILPNNIRKLDISYNKLNSLKGLEQLIQLNELNISNNQITSLKELNNFNKLIELRCSNNNIISNDVIILDNLMILDISYNKLVDINIKSNSIAELYISNNNITINNSFELYPYLEILDISSNNIELNGLDILINKLKDINLNELIIKNNPCSLIDTRYIINDSLPDYVTKIGDTVTSLDIIDGYSVKKPETEDEPLPIEEMQPIKIKPLSEEVQEHHLKPETIKSKILIDSEKLINNRHKQISNVKVIASAPDLFKMPDAIIKMKKKPSEKVIKTNPSTASLKSDISTTNLKKMEVEKVDLTELPEDIRAEMYELDKEFGIDSILMEAEKIPEREGYKLTNTRAAALLEEIETSLNVENKKIHSLCGDARSNLKFNIQVNDPFSKLSQDRQESVQYVIENYKSSNSGTADRLSKALDLLEVSSNLGYKNSNIDKDSDDEDVDVDISKALKEKEKEDADISEWIAKSKERRRTRNLDRAKLRKEEADIEVEDTYEALPKAPIIVVEEESDSKEIENLLANIQNRVKNRLDKNMSIKSEQIFSSLANNKDREYIVKTVAKKMYKLPSTKKRIEEIKKNSEKSTLNHSIENESTEFKFATHIVEDKAIINEETKGSKNESPQLPLSASLSFSFNSKPNPIAAANFKPIDQNIPTSKYLDRTVELRDRFNAILSSKSLTMGSSIETTQLPLEPNSFRSNSTRSNSSVVKVEPHIELNNIEAHPKSFNSISKSFATDLILTKSSTSATTDTTIDESADFEDEDDSNYDDNYQHDDKVGKYEPFSAPTTNSMKINSKLDFFMNDMYDDMNDDIVAADSNNQLNNNFEQPTNDLNSVEFKVNSEFIRRSESLPTSNDHPLESSRSNTNAHTERSAVVLPFKQTIKMPEPKFSKFSMPSAAAKLTNKSDAPNAAEIFTPSMMFRKGSNKN